MEIYNQIKESVPLSTVAAALNIPVTRTTTRCDCPFHDCQAKRQFKVMSDRFFRCYSCKRYGSVFDLVMHYEGISLKETLHRILEITGTSVAIHDTKTVNKIRAEAWAIYKQVAVKNWHIVDRYARSRGWSSLDMTEVGLSLSSNTLTTHGMSTLKLERAFLVDPKRKSREYYSNHLIFPIYNEHGQLVHFNGRNLDVGGDNELRWMSLAGNPAVSNYFFNSKALYHPQENYIVLCEGVSDCLSLLQLGVPALGQMSVYANLAQHHQAFSVFDGIIAAYDRDRHALGSENGGEYKSWGPMLPRLIDLMCLTRKPIYYLMPPDHSGIKDINDWMVDINYDIEVYAEYGRNNLRHITELAIQVYADKEKEHEYVWRALAADRQPTLVEKWRDLLVHRYGSLEDYLLQIHR